LNKKFFKRGAATDVIAFPLNEKGCFGEVIISVERAVKAAPRFGNTWQDEFLTYVIHGILHIWGYNDIKPKDRVKMFAKQDELFNQLKK
jgi:probable rRNA maturation factor